MVMQQEVDRTGGDVGRREQQDHRHPAADRDSEQRDDDRPGRHHRDRTERQDRQRDTERPASADDEGARAEHADRDVDRPRHGGPGPDRVPERHEQRAVDEGQPDGDAVGEPIPGRRATTVRRVRHQEGEGQRRHVRSLRGTGPI
jgi:hypothetical protein